MGKCANENVCENRGRFFEFLWSLGGAPKGVRRLARSAASFAGVRRTLDHIEEEIIVAAGRVSVLGSVEGLIFHAKPALRIDLDRASLAVPTKMKV